MKLQIKKAFTLVELIIVITILAILATIGFISFQSYTRDARDSNRITTLDEVSKGIQLFNAKNTELPLPDNTTLQLNAMGEIIGYRGTIDKSLSNLVKMTSTPIDPLSKSSLAYGVDYTRKKYQLAVVLESELSSNNLINNTYADTLYKAKVIGNYSGTLNFSTGGTEYTANLPSLIYNYSGSLNSTGITNIDINTDKSKIYYVVNNGKNFPYSLDGGSINNEILLGTVYKANTIPLPPQGEFFDSIWNTTYITGSVTANNQIKLPLVSNGTYNFIIDWGDGNTNTITSRNQAETTHTYAIQGQKEIKIKGIIKGWVFNYGGDKTKLLEIKSWGPLNLGNNGNYFYGASNMVLTNVSDVLDLSGTTNMQSAFSSCSGITIVPYMNLWDTSKVTNMIRLFNFDFLFNQNINDWDTSKVTTMNLMFNNATSFNQPLNNWDVSSVTDMKQMFNNATNFNQPLNNWNVSNVKYMDYMFESNNFDQPLNNWNVSNLLSISYMFAYNKFFNQPLNNWNVSNVTNFVGMFFNTSFNQPLNNWNTSSGTDMSYMFSGTPFNQPLNNWNVSNVTNFVGMFSGRFNSGGDCFFNQDISMWNVSKANDMRYMFFYATRFNQNLSSWIVNPNVTNCISFSTSTTAWTLAKPGFTSCTP
ncbi:MAG: BspA family leucine-rich repeat surface protein [Candidatus Gracilibacteria bacterium]|nr:BspA family leucine-rich repeat surface protein [Candidatus Gracilibacteria bacterium]